MQRDVAEFFERREVFITDGDHSSRGKPAGAYGENEQTKCEHEVGDNQKRRSHSGKSAIRQAPESRGAPDSQGKSQRPRHQSRDYREQQCVSGAHPQQWRNRTVVGKRVAHLPVQERIHPSRVAHRQGPVKLILRAQSSDCFRRNLWIQPHLIEIVSGREGRKQKSKDGDTDQEKRCLQQSAKKVTHQPTCGVCATAPSLGVAAIKRRVTSFCGSRKTLSAAPSSTTFPRSITAISSDRCPAMAKSCVMKRYVRPSEDCNSRSRLAICACTEQSSAESASSRISSFGSSARARAIASLCLCPPLNSSALCKAFSCGRPTCARSVRARTSLSRLFARPRTSSGSLTSSKAENRGFSDRAGS